MTNFESFYKVLNESGCNELNLTFEQLKFTLGDLPEESNYRNWWSNDNANEYSKTWCSAGYHVKKVIPDCYVCFIKIDKVKGIENNQQNNEEPNTVESIRTLHNSPTSTTKKETDYTGYHVFGGVLMAIDLIIWIPLLIKNFLRKNTFIPILVIGGIIYFISLLLVCMGRSGGHFGSGYSDSYYEQAMYNEMKYHNMKMREMAMTEQMQRTQEEVNRRHQSEPSLAEKFDTRITNIFRNPWEGIL